MKFAKAKEYFCCRHKNLGEQAEQEFIKYQPRDDNRKFTELYNVQRLTSSYIANDARYVFLRFKAILYFKRERTR